jgi:hypothetical protein
MSRKKGLPFTKPKTRVQTPQPFTNSTDHDKNKTKKTRNTPTYGEMIKDPIHPGNDAPGIHEDCNPKPRPRNTRKLPVLPALSCFPSNGITNHGKQGNKN